MQCNLQDMKNKGWSAKTASTTRQRPKTDNARDVQPLACTRAAHREWRGENEARQESDSIPARAGGASVLLPFLPREISQTCRHGVAWEEEGEDELGTCITNTHARMALRSAAMSISPTERVAAAAKDIAAGRSGIQHGDVNAAGVHVLRCV